MKCGLLGQKLAHSYSPVIHSMLGNYSYDLYEKEPEELACFLKNGDFTGINVTIPYKKSVIPYLDTLTPQASRLGAVNTILRQPDGRLLGHNTDYYGFQYMVSKSGVSVQDKKVLVLGSGGASNTAVAVLQELGADVVIISRSGANHYENLYLHRDAKVIVNTTPVGMYPNTMVSPIDIAPFSKLEIVLDVIYNPSRTKLILDAEAMGIPSINGLWMLVAQAKEAAEWFSGHKISDEIIPKIHRTLSKKMKNIVLVGMPGSGKTTVGKILERKLGRKLIDIDEEIERSAGVSIADIFYAEGEMGFRQRESQIISAFGKESGLILSTGGGCVTIPENDSLLHQNGTVFWLRRDISLLPKDGRPLSMKQDLAHMYQIREPMYRSFADCIVDNNTTAEDTADKIISILEEST